MYQTLQKLIEIIYIKPVDSSPQFSLMETPENAIISSTKTAPGAPKKSKIYQFASSKTGARLRVLEPLLEKSSAYDFDISNGSNSVCESESSTIEDIDNIELVHQESDSRANSPSGNLLNMHTQNLISLSSFDTMSTFASATYKAIVTPPSYIDLTKDTPISSPNQLICITPDNVQQQKQAAQAPMKENLQQQRSHETQSQQHHNELTVSGMMEVAQQPQVERELHEVQQPMHIDVKSQVDDLTLQNHIISPPFQLHRTQNNCANLVSYLERREGICDVLLQMGNNINNYIAIPTNFNSFVIAVIGTTLQEMVNIPAQKPLYNLIKALAECNLCILQNNKQALLMRTDANLQMQILLFEAVLMQISTQLAQQDSDTSVQCDVPKSIATIVEALLLNYLNNFKISNSKLRTDANQLLKKMM